MRKLSVFLTVSLLAGVAKLQPIQPVVVMGSSMEPTFKNMQCLLTTRRFDTIRRGDVVVFQQDGGTIIKRVAYLPGDKITVFMDSYKWRIPACADEDYDLRRSKDPRKTIVVPPGTVFVLGDNANDSVDSRDFGPVPIESISGKVLDYDGNGVALKSARYARLVSINRTASGDWS